MPAVFPIPVDPDNVRPWFKREFHLIRERRYVITKCCLEEKSCQLQFLSGIKFFNPVTNILGVEDMH